jgi:hypothetical protein
LVSQDAVKDAWRREDSESESVLPPVTRLDSRFNTISSARAGLEALPLLRGPVGLMIKPVKMFASASPTQPEYLTTNAIRGNMLGAS